MPRWTLETFAIALCLSASVARGADDTDLARRARAVIQQDCLRCHHGKGSPGGDADFLDRDGLVKLELIKPGAVGESTILERVLKGEMPPPGESPRPSVDDAGVLWEWIAGGAPAFPRDVAARPRVELASVLGAAAAHLRRADAADRPNLRYFTLHNLANDPAASDADLRIARAALSKAVNSLSRKPRIVVPEAVDAAKAVFAVNVADLDWDRAGLWNEVERAYPYGLKYGSHPDPTLRKLDEELCELSGSILPVIRADWFVATATRPPLYHALLGLPDDARKLEHDLGVDVAGGFERPRPERIARAGFPRSGVSGQNRMVERLDARDGYYWKSYDFKPGNGRSKLTRFPLGPLALFEEGRHPFPNQAFVHDGGEIIFGLPNGLQAYLLVNGKDGRIDVGPIDVVADSLRTSGTTEIVNGVSCMACHKHGMLPMDDAIRVNSAVFGAAEEQVRRLYPPKAAMDELVKGDEARFLAALEKAVGPSLREGADKSRPIRTFPEPVSEVARPYRLGYLDLAAVARELDVADPREVERAAGATELKRLGLDALLTGGVVGRAEWESTYEGKSLMQQLARSLKYTPVTPR